jgi:hypothetical protein
MGTDRGDLRPRCRAGSAERRAANNPGPASDSGRDTVPACPCLRRRRPGGRRCCHPGDRRWRPGQRAADVLEIVEHVGPSARARRVAVDEHHRDTTRPERLDEGQAGGLHLPRQVSAEEPLAFPAPLRRLAERPRERRGRLNFERDIAAVDRDGSLIGVAVDLEGRAQHGLRQLAAGIVDAEQRGHRGPGVRPEMVHDLLVGIDGRRPRCERCPDPRSPVP